jgi:imidazolonepropionase-like amidohydrolase
MRSTLFHLTLALGVFLPAIVAQGSSGNTMKKPSSLTYITHVTVVDATAGIDIPDRTVIISSGRIVEVTASKSARPRSKQVLEGKGKFLIPGLWDMHVHAVSAERLDSMLPMFVANGVLGIRDMGTSMALEEIDQLRKATQTGARLGPLIVAAGPILDGRPKPLRANFLAINSPEAGRAEVDALKSSGADFIKVYSFLSKDTFLAIADEARKQKIFVAGHVPFSVSALEASDAGFNSMEHLFGVFLSCSSREDELRAEMLKGGPNLGGWDQIQLEALDAADSYDAAKAAKVFAHLAKNGTWQVPTLTAVWAHARGFDAQVTSDPRLRYIPLSVRQRWSEEAKSSTHTASIAKFYEQKLRMLGDLHRAGVPVMAGTDAAWYQAYTYAGFSLHDELALLARAGFTPAEALQSATIDPARFLRMDRDMGSIDKGKRADLVLLAADPLQDVANTQKIEAVIVGGRVLERKALDSLLADAENAVKSR